MLKRPVQRVVQLDKDSIHSLFMEWELSPAKFYDFLCELKRQRQQLESQNENENENNNLDNRIYASGGQYLNKRARIDGVATLTTTMKNKQQQSLSTVHKHKHLVTAQELLDLFHLKIAEIKQRNKDTSIYTLRSGSTNTADGNGDSTYIYIYIYNPNIRTYTYIHI